MSIPRVRVACVLCVCAVQDEAEERREAASRSRLEERREEERREEERREEARRGEARRREREGEEEARHEDARLREVAAAARRDAALDMAKGAATAQAHCLSEPEPAPEP